MLHKYRAEKDTSLLFTLWIKYSTVIEKTSPGAILGSIFSKSVENFENIRDKNFLEFHLVYISVFKIFLGQKLRELLIADFEQIWDFFPFFQFLTILSTVFLASFMLK